MFYDDWKKCFFITMISLETNCCLFFVYLSFSTFSALIIFHILIFKLTEGVNTKLILSMETNTKGFFFAFRCLLQITHRIQKKLCYYFNTASYFEVSFFHGLILIWRIQLSFYPLLQYKLLDEYICIHYLARCIGMVLLNKLVQKYFVKKG